MLRKERCKPLDRRISATYNRITWCVAQRLIKTPPSSRWRG